MVGAFATGLLVGLSVVVFVGYAAVAVLETAALGGLGCGLAAGLGIATADALWAAVAAAVTVVNRTLLPWSGYLNWAAVTALTFFCVLAVRELLRSSGVDEAGPRGTGTAPGAYRAYLAATVREPVTVIFFLTLTVGFLPHYRAGEWAVFVAGVFLASLVWQVGMSIIGVRRGRVLSPGVRRRVMMLDVILLVVFIVFVAAAALGFAR